MRADVVVIGSGGAGLLAACLAADAGRQVLVLERAPLLGGTTAVSGGMLWLPDNPLMPAFGVPDSGEDALRYLERVTEGTVEPWRLTQFVQLGRELLRYLHARTPVRLFPIDRPDYHCEWPGARNGGRTLDNEPFETASRPGLADRIRAGPHFTALTYEEKHRWRTPNAEQRELIATRQRRRVLTVGRALVAALVAACDERGVRFWTGARANRLELEQGRVAGVRVQTSDGPTVVQATTGVVLASGGFEWNRELAQAFLGKANIVPVSPPGNSGDGLTMAMTAGAALGAMSEAWWAPVVCPPEQTYDGAQLSRHLVAERCLPGSIMVNRYGRRFVNEALNYNDLTKALLAFDPAGYQHPNSPAWLLFDEGYRRRYPAGFLTSADPSSADPASADHSAAGPAPDWLCRGSSIGELAARTGIDLPALTETLGIFNDFARRGTDPAFGRGRTAHDRYYGDEDWPGNPCLGPIEEPPFYAVEVLAGTLGTKGGVLTDHAGRVLRADGTMIAGLFACGNVAASLMGPGYPGSGGTLGPALVGGYLCGRGLGRAAESR
ncbi:MAG: FAD-dependent oxidoreductase [Jatrophihabitantaceae bacterium]